MVDSFTNKSKSILILAGTPREFIDGVRYFANHARPENYGEETAKLLEAQGYKVTLVMPNASIVSARDLIKAAENYAGQGIGAVLQLANISSIRSAHISAQKLKVKKEGGHTVPMEVAGNIDVWKRLKAIFPGVPIIGYRDNQITATNHSALVAELIAVIPAKAGIQSNHVLERKRIELDTRFRGYDTLASRKVIITTSPTAEQLTTQGDVITNFSTGRQGYTIAEALANMGAKVTLITATTAHELYNKVMAALPADAYIGVAAVADFGIEKPIDLQLKEGEPYTLQLVQNPDILQSVCTHSNLRPKVVIGFAAETDQRHLLEHARDKLMRKGADAICANAANAAGSKSNQITWVDKNGAEPWEIMDKSAVGRAIGLKLSRMLIA